MSTWSLWNKASLLLMTKHCLVEEQLHCPSRLPLNYGPKTTRRSPASLLHVVICLDTQLSLIWTVKLIFCHPHSHQEQIQKMPCSERKPKSHFLHPSIHYPPLIWGRDTVAATWAGQSRPPPPLAPPGQPGDIITPVFPGSSPTVTCPEHITREAFIGHPDQMPDALSRSSNYFHDLAPLFTTQSSWGGM